jgi:hypothetical protein
MKVRIKTQPSGLLNGQPWPEAGEEIDVPDVVGADLCAAGNAEPVAEKAKAEKRPAMPKAETRKKA